MNTVLKSIIMRFLLLANFFSSIVISFAIDCDIPGSCYDNIVIDASDEPNLDNCIQYCRDLNECSWYTYEPESLICGAFKSCDHISNQSCSSCLSGEVECPLSSECDIQGKCEGKVANIIHSPNSRECHLACQANANCRWYTFHNRICQLLKTNDVIDETCQNCRCGKKECNPGNI